MSTNDPIIDELLKGVDLENEEPQKAYGVGKWPDAALEDVTEQEKSDYGYSVKLRFDLAGIGGGKTFTAFLNLPQSPNGDADAKRISEVRKNNLASIMHAGELLPANKRFPVVDDEATYAKLVNIFRAGIGRTFPIQVRARKNDPSRVDVWGLKVSK